MIVAENESKLAEAIELHGVNLFLGAGVSNSAGLPSWRTLTELMIKRAWPHGSTLADLQNMTFAGMARKADPVEAMRLIQRKLGDTFLDELRLVLYDQSQPTSQLLLTLAGLKCTVFVCTYNFDDLLEKAAASIGRDFRVLTPGDRFPTEGRSQELAIAHPHGFLPQYRTAAEAPTTIQAMYQERFLQKATATVVLTEDDYHFLYLNQVGWANLLQLRALLARPSLFLGCSLADPNIRRLLSLTKLLSPHPHFAVFRHPFKSREDQTGWSLAFRTPMAVAMAEIYSAMGITPLWVEEFDEIPALLQRLDGGYR